MATGGPRPAAGQVPPQGMVLQHAHNPQGQIMPIITNPAAGHFAPGGNFAAQIPLQHQQRQMMNNIPPGPHTNYPTIHGNQAAITIARPSQMRQLQQTSIPPNSAALGQLGPYQPQLQSQLHQQHLQQMQQQFQQANPALRLGNQHPLIPGHNIVQPQPIATPAIQHMGGPQGPQSSVASRYIFYSSFMLNPRHPLPLQRLTQFAWQLSAVHPAVSSFSSMSCTDHILENERKLLADVCTRMVCSSSKTTTCTFRGRSKKQRIRYFIYLCKTLIKVELPSVLIHHFFHSVHTSGVRQMHIVLGDPEVDPRAHAIHCSHASIIYRLENGSQVMNSHSRNLHD